MAVLHGKNYGKPTLDLNFAGNKSLIDTTTGTNYVTFTRAQSGNEATYVGSDGLIKYASADEARFDHDPVTGECLGLLIEESRTNPLKYSGELDRSTDWTVTGGSTSNTTAPDNTNDAVIFTEDTATNYHGFVAQGGNRPTMSGQIAASVFIKPGTRRYVVISFGAGSNGVCVTVDTQNMTVSEATSYGTGYTYTAGSATIDSMVNSWHRVSFAGNSSASTNQVFIIRGTNIATGNTFGESYLGDGSTFSSWGAQLEAGAFPTSYIPTSGSTVPRAADVASITGSNFSRWYNQSEGTVFIDHARVNPSNTYYAFDISDGTGNNRIANFSTSTNDYYLFVDSGTTYLNSSQTFATGFHKKAFAYGVNDLRGAIDGSLPSAWQDSVAPVISSTRTQLAIGRGVTIPAAYSQRFKRLTYYPYRLPDATLQEITS